MSVTSTDVELSAAEIAELHHDIAIGLMDLANSQTAATVTSAGSSAINQINQWPKKPTAISGDEGLRAVEHACGHQLYELLHQFLSNHQFLLQAVETNFSFTDFIAEVHSKATRATLEIESIQSDIALAKSTMTPDLPQQGSARDRAVLTSKFQRFADSDDNNETYLQEYFDAMRATSPYVESPHFGVPLTPHGSLTLDVIHDLANLQAAINAAEKTYSERQRYRELLERKHKLLSNHYEAIYSIESDLPIMDLLRGRPIPHPRGVHLKSESRKPPSTRATTKSSTTKKTIITEVEDEDQSEDDLTGQEPTARDRLQELLQMVDHRASSHADYLQRQTKHNDARVAEWTKQLTELIKQKHAYLLAGQIAETTLTTYANLGTKISTMTQHVPSIRTNLNSSIKIRLTGTTVTRSLDQAHIPGLYAVLVKYYKHAELGLVFNNLLSWMTKSANLPMTPKNRKHFITHAFGSFAHSGYTITNDLFFSVLLLMNIPDGVLRTAMTTKAMSFFQDHRVLFTAGHHHASEHTYNTPLLDLLVEQIDIMNDVSAFRSTQPKPSNNPKYTKPRLDLDDVNKKLNSVSPPHGTDEAYSAQSNKSDTHKKIVKTAEFTEFVPRKMDVWHYLSPSNRLVPYTATSHRCKKCYSSDETNTQRLQGHCEPTCYGGRCTECNLIGHKVCFQKKSKPSATASGNHYAALADIEDEHEDENL
jgi:hypothetical protein